MEARKTDKLCSVDGLFDDDCAADSHWAVSSAACVPRKPREGIVRVYLYTRYADSPCFSLELRLRRVNPRRPKVAGIWATSAVLNAIGQYPRDLD